MKFIVHYGRNFLKKETGKQMVKRLLSGKPENEYNKNIVSVPDNMESVPMAPYFNAGLGRPYDDGI
jgi:hypothetical protein